MIAIDKQAHFFSGWAGAATLYPIAGIYALLPVAAAAVAKEWWDAQGHGTPDKWDAAATVLGGVAGVLASYLVFLVKLI